MGSQSTFTVSTGFELKRRRSVTTTSRAFISVLFVFALGFAGNAGAVVPNQPPEKKIVIVNNSAKRVFFPMVQKGATIGNPDLWMQAVFVQSGNFPNFAQKTPYPPFGTKLVSRGISISQIKIARLV